MTSILPAHPGEPPTGPHCTCMSGITAEQLEMLKLAAVFEFANWFTFQAEMAVSGPAPIGNPAAHDWLLKVRAFLTKCEHEARSRAFPEVTP